MLCQRTKPRVVRAGMEGGLKSSSGVGWRVCWQPIDAYIQDMLGFGTSTNRAGDTTYCQPCDDRSKEGGVAAQS